MDGKTKHTATRRTALAMLGLAPAAAVGSETFNKAADEPGQPQVCCSAYDPERYASAFRQIATDISEGKIEAHALTFRSEILPDMIADVHEFTFKFRYVSET